MSERQTNDPLVKLLHHSGVRKHTDLNLLAGLSGTTLVDTAIGYVEKAVFAELRRSPELGAMYTDLRGDPTYKRFFPGRSNRQIETKKPDSYKATQTCGH
tara:strand:- start:651 stop:950 length:300 start_codon:yes stop_codon:yes gene_type:complete